MGALISTMSTLLILGKLNKLRGKPSGVGTVPINYFKDEQIYTIIKMML